MRRLLIVAATGVLAAATGAGSGAAVGSGRPIDRGPSPAVARVAAGHHHHQDRIPGTHCTAFPSNNVWHADISKLPVDSHSKEWVKHIGHGLDLHPDFGPSFGAQPVPYGIPVTVVSKSHAKVHVKFQYSSESDHVHYPLGHDTKIEGGRHASGDRHAIMVDKSNCHLYETWLTRHHHHHWTAGSGATWSLTSNKLRHNHWTSADAAGLPILPGLLRYHEVKAGYVDHAIRFTAPTTSTHYLWPARHEAGSTHSKSYPPMGARFRLKSGFSMKGYNKHAKVVLRAMKTYGLILADNGSPWYFQGDDSHHWHNHLISELKTIPAKEFQAVDESSLQKSKNSGAVR
jgi:hypothetical protein